MLNVKHTPGTWHRSQTEVIAEADNSSGYVSIAMINVRLEESNENASVIAASPNLLAACERAITAMVQLGNLLNWPEGIPQSYADAINMLREARDIAHGGEGIV